MAPALARAARRRLEVLLAGYRLASPKVRDARVEWAAFPSMIELYWALAEAGPLGAPPSQTDFGREVAARLPDLPGDIEEVRAFID